MVLLRLLETVTSPFSLSRAENDTHVEKIETAAHNTKLSGLLLRAIINLRFIFIGKLQSRPALTKQKP